MKNVLDRFKGSFQKLDSLPILKSFLFLILIPLQLIYLLHFLQSPGSHSIEVQSLALASRQKSTGFSATKAEINGGEPFAIQVKTREIQQLSFSRRFGSGNNHSVWN